MSIKQVNATYLVQEDRILFRFNTQDKAEYLLWFTRRVTLFFLVATSHLLTKNLEQAHSPDAAKALNEFADIDDLELKVTKVEQQQKELDKKEETVYYLVKLKKEIESFKSKPILAIIQIDRKSVV